MSSTRPHHSVYLASGSPRRYEILASLGYQVHRLSAAIDETPQAGEPARQYVQRMACEKNLAARSLWPAVSGQLPEFPLISADTSVALDNLILGKPADANDAAAMLRSLSGRTHQVLTAVCVFWQGCTHQAVQVSEVSFSVLSEAQIQAYIASHEPFDKAGAYGIQGVGGTFVSHMQGSFTGIMGLPVYETTQLLAQCQCAPL